MPKDGPWELPAAPRAWCFISLWVSLASKEKQPSNCTSWACKQVKHKQCRWAAGHLWFVHLVHGTKHSSGSSVMWWSRPGSAVSVHLGWTFLWHKHSHCIWKGGLVVFLFCSTSHLSPLTELMVPSSVAQFGTRPSSEKQGKTFLKLSFKPRNDVPYLKCVFFQINLLRMLFFIRNKYSAISMLLNLLLNIFKKCNACVACV